MDWVQIYVICLVVLVLASSLVDLGKGKENAFLIIVLNLLLWWPILGRILGLF